MWANNNPLFSACEKSAYREFSSWIKAYSIIGLLVTLRILGGEPGSQRTATEYNIDFDDILLSEYAPCFSIIAEPDRYQGKTIRVSGFIGSADSRGEVLFANRDSVMGGLIENGVFLDQSKLEAQNSYNLDKIRNKNSCMVIYGKLNGMTNVYSPIGAYVEMPVVDVMRFMFTSTKKEYDESINTSKKLVSTYELLINPHKYINTNVIVRGYIVNKDNGICYLAPNHEASIYFQLESFFVLNTNHCSNAKDFENARMRGTVQKQIMTLEVRYEGISVDVNSRNPPKMPEISLIRFIE